MRDKEIQDKIIEAEKLVNQISSALIERTTNPLNFEYLSGRFKSLVNIVKHVEGQFKFRMKNK
jgi:hypothetical protein